MSSQLRACSWGWENTVSSLFQIMFSYWRCCQVSSFGFPQAKVWVFPFIVYFRLLLSVFFHSFSIQFLRGCLKLHFKCLTWMAMGRFLQMSLKRWDSNDNKKETILCFALLCLRPGLFVYSIFILFNPKSKIPSYSGAKFPFPYDANWNETPWPLHYWQCAVWPHKQRDKRILIWKGFGQEADCPEVYWISKKCPERSHVPWGRPLHYINDF